MYVSLVPHLSNTVEPFILRSFRCTVTSFFTVIFAILSAKNSHILVDRDSTGNNSICTSASAKPGNVREYEILETSALVCILTDVVAITNKVRRVRTPW